MLQRQQHITSALLLLLAAQATAAPLADSQIPPALKPWKEWVLLDHQDRLCPAQGENRVCTWPSTLHLALNTKDGHFTQTARLYAAGWLRLPGAATHWPQNVLANGKPAPVLSHENGPAVRLPAGDYRLEGQFAWPQRPNSLPVPDNSGLITLQLEGSSVPPQFDSEGHLALGQGAISNTPEDHIEFKVFRKLDDDIPLLLSTHIKLQVSGKPRETTLGPVLPAGFLPLGLSGNLPARLDADGQLSLQLRPGIWTLDITARATAPLSRLAQPAQAAPWPNEEVWSFQAHPELRVVEVGGAPSLDPRQTQVPQDWQALPAYLMQGKATLNFAEKQRGAASLEANQLTLQRQLWLDSDGQGFTLQDRLNGQLHHPWRLEAEPPIVLGQVLVNEEAQLITRRGQVSGVEVRNSQLSLTADSRIAGSARRLPVAGWNVDMNNVELQLHLPPGWRLFAAPGTDNVPDSWLSRWTLLDLFVVLIISIAALRLFGPLIAGLSLLTLALTWQEPGAPRWLWLNLILVIALVRALPSALRDSPLARWLSRYRWLAAFMLVLAAVPFTIQQVRLGLYPQLEQGDSFAQAEAATEVDMAAEIAADAPAAAPEEARSKRYYGADLLASGGSYDSAKAKLLKLDPSIITQTGPGLPQWSGHTVQLNWNGSISPGQHYRLWLQPPWLTRSLEFLHGLLIAAVLACWMGLRPGQFPSLPWRRAAGSALPLLLLAYLLPSPPAQADTETAIAPTPSQAIEVTPPATSLLDQLRERLLAPAACSPDCIEIPRLRLAVVGERLDLRLTVDAAIASALPLPQPLRSAEARGWQADSILLDGRPAALHRDSQGLLWASVPEGRHDILISGSLQGLSQLQLPLPQRPRLVSADTGSWQLAGVDAQGQAGATLQLTAAAKPLSEGQANQPENALSPLLRITRTLTLGQDWDVHTTVERIGSSQAPALLKLPLLHGESITGGAVTAKDGHVQLSLAPGQSSLSWSSRLAIAPTLQLRAMAGSDAYEIWRLQIGPLWHVEFKGVPPVQQVEDGIWRPRFQPWPGETLELAISRPGGAPGRSLTLDRSTLVVAPTSRATETTLTLQLRSSQGGQHRLRLPAQTQVSALTIDGQVATPRLEGEWLVLPLHPGAQTIELALRNNVGLQTLQRSPALDLGLPGINTQLQLKLPDDRWILVLGGPQQGPAVLFWGVLLVLMAIAYGLGRLPFTPLRRRDWALLMVGLSQLPVFGAALVVLWLLALGARSRIGLAHWSYRRFNALQVGLVVLSLSALGLLFTAIAQGLLGSPDMQVTGNGSYGNQLRWFQDRHEQTLPQAWVLSVSIWFYRLLMLLWAMWLANALLGWLRWGWGQFTADGLWKKKPLIVQAAKTAPEPE